MQNATTFIRRELMIRFVRAFDSGEIAAELDHIPVKLRPKDVPSSRCCVYHDRAVLKYRLMSLLGVSPHDETDESKTLAAYVSEIVDGEKPSADTPAGKVPLSVCGTACSGCPDARVVSTENCRGCFARPCMYNCPKKAISIVEGHSVVDQSLCIKCGKCISACPYHAIVKTSVPCEEACPVGAIRKNANGVAEINFSKCIFCGKCLKHCPFGAVMERSQLFDLLLAMKRGEKVIAMLAPACGKQFPGSVEQLMTACVKAGFSDVMEVALGAEKTTEHETAEFVERFEKDPKTLMTTSCCPAYVNLVAKHYPDFMPHVSTTPSPMVFAKDMVKAKDPAARTVFVGPCVAKRDEAQRTGVDFVLTFEELGALLAGRGVDVMASEPMVTERPACDSARGYAHSHGVTEAVLGEAAAKLPDLKFDTKQINGLDKKTAMQIKLYSMGKLPGNFLEVMACEGGCEQGPGCL